MFNIFLHQKQTHIKLIRKFSVESVNINKFNFTLDFLKNVIKKDENYLIVGKKLYDWKVANFIYWKFPNMKEVHSNSVLLKYKSRKFLLELIPTVEIRKAIKKIPNSNEERITQYNFIIDTLFKTIGYLYENNGENEVENFFEDFIFSKSIEIQDILESFRPHEELSEIYPNLLYQQKTDSKNELIMTEIYSNDFLIGVGSSLSNRLSKDQAAKNALISYYTQEANEEKE